MDFPVNKPLPRPPSAINSPPREPPEKPDSLPNSVTQKALPKVPQERRSWGATKCENATSTRPARRFNIGTARLNIAPESPEQSPDHGEPPTLPHRTHTPINTSTEQIIPIPTEEAPTPISLPQNETPSFPPVPARLEKSQLSDTPIIPEQTPPTTDESQNETPVSNIVTKELPKPPSEIAPNSSPDSPAPQPVFRGQWNPSVPAPKPQSFIPSPGISLLKTENGDKLPATNIDSDIEDEISQLRHRFSTIAPPAPTPDSDSDLDVDIDDLPPAYGASDDEDEDESPPGYGENDEYELPPPAYGYEEEDEDPPEYGEEDDEFDDEEVLAFLESEMETQDDELGTESLEECKILVQWGPYGDAPPVPSRDDPSHQLSEEKAQKFIQQKEEVPDAYRIIKDDPRYQRLRLKWAPDVFTGEGAIQFAKNKVDPATLPYVGILFHMNRVKDAVQGHQKVDKIAAGSSEELSNSMDTFKGAMKTRGLQESAYTGVAACCMMLPVVDFIPGLSAQLMILGEVGAGVAESGIEMGLKVLISKGTGQVAASQMERTDAFGGFGSSKAFLLYIGLPKTDDPLYAEWEPYRLKLKALYGCAPEDNLMKMKPKGKLLKQLREEERKSGKPYQVEVPLLVLLYRAFDCWHELYWDRIVNLKESAKGKTRSTLGLRRQLTLDERRRMRDYRKLQETASVIESKKAIDPHLKILRKDKKKEIVNLLTKSLLYSYHVAYLFSRKKTREEQVKHLKWFMKMVVDYFMAHNAFFWGYVGTDKELKAIAIWDRPNESAKISFLSMLRTNGALKLGPNRWKKMSDILFKMEEIRKNDIRGLRCWMLHWIAVDPRFQKQGIGELLIRNTLSRHDEPIYIQLFDMETEMVAFLKKMCFIPVCHEYSKFTLYGQKVSTVAYWYGMNSPSELRALLPSKKKNPLQLTYSTIRKAASIQSLPGRVNQTQLRIANEQYIRQSEENKLLQEAQQRYEETATLLDHLKMDLAKLPTATRDTDPVALSLQSKIDEYQHLVDIYRASLNDAKNNVNSLMKPLQITNG